MSPYDEEMGLIITSSKPPNPDEEALNQLPSTRFEDEIYPRHAEHDVMDEIYKAYMKGGDLIELAALYDVEESTIKYWAKVGGWVKERAALDEVLIEESNRKLVLARARKVHKIVDQTIEVQGKITAKVGEMMDDEEKVWKPSELRALSDAAKQASSGSLQAVGVAESGALASDVAKAEAAKQGKQPLVMIFQGGGLPPVKKSTAEKVIEVHETETTE